MNFKYNDDYFQRTYAGWLGKLIGIRLGSEIEGWSYEKINKTYGEIRDYVMDYTDYAADDDSNGPNFFARTLLDFPEEIDSITEQQMAQTLLNYVPDHHGFFWWGGYGISTEQTSYENLRAGVSPKLSGSISLNGKTVAEQIGGQIFSDVWGFIFPDDTEKAAAYARKMSAISYDGEGLSGSAFVASAVSAAYADHDIRIVIEKALQVIGPCEYSAMARDVIDFHDKNDRDNWRLAFEFVKNKYGYQNYPGACHIIPNAAVMILSMLYGEGDFSRTVCIACSCGWDTDCNAGNVGAILGVMVGLDGLEKRWTEPIHDLLISSSVIGQLNLDTVASSAERFSLLGCKAARVDPPFPWSERALGDDILWHFDMKGSTQCLRCDDKSVKLENIENGVLPGHRALSVKFTSQTELYFKTYYGQCDLTDSRYDPSFTPLVYPGQRISFLIRNVSASPLNAWVFIVDGHDGIMHLDSDAGQVILAPGETGSIEYRIPSGMDWLVRRIGLGLDSNGESDVLIDNCRISGDASFKLDFNKEWMESYLPYYGQKHTEVSQCSYSKGLWVIKGSYVSGSCADEADLLTGPYYARDYQLAVSLTPLCGQEHRVDFRVQGMVRYYVFGFEGERAVLRKRQGLEERELAAVSFGLKPDQTYRLMVTVNHNRIVASIDGERLLDYVDEDSPYLYGQVGMGVRKGSHCLFSDLTFTSLHESCAK